MDRQRRKESNEGEKKKGRRKLYTKPHGPGMSFTSDHDVSGSSNLPGMKTDGFSAHLVLKRKKGSTKKSDHDEENVLGSDDDIFIKPKAAKAQKSSSLCEQISLTSRSPQIQSPLKRPKLRKSLSRVSPRQRILSGSLSGSAEKKRRHTVSMMTVDMKRLQDTMDRNQRRKNDKKNENVKAHTDGVPFKMPCQKLGTTESVDNDRATCIGQIEKFNGRKKRYHNSKEQEHHRRDEATTSKHKRNGERGGQPDKDLLIFEEMSNPSQELFTDNESGNETDTRAVVQRTVSRFLSSQEAQNDFRKPNPSPMDQRSSISADMNNPDSEVSESSDDEANETVLEKEIRSFFKSKKRHSPSQREVTLAANVAMNCVQHQGTEGGMSDESDVITAGQKVQSEQSEIIYAGQMMESQTESEVITAGQKMQSDESEVITAGQKMQTQTEHDDVMDEDTLHSTPDSPGSLEDGQRLSDDNSNTGSQGMGESEIVREQDDRGGNSHEDIVSREENAIQTISQMHQSPTSLDVDSSDDSYLEIGGSSDASPIPFHSTPVEPTYHTESHTEQEAPNAVSPSLTEVKRDKKIFELYCHKDTTPRILKALESCGNIDSRTLASAGVDDGPMCIEVIRGKVFEEAVDRTRAVTSPNLFEDNSDGIDGGMEIEEVEHVTKPARQKNPKRNVKDAENSKPMKPKKKKKRKKFPAIPGNTTVTSRVRVINGPIKGDARKKNEYRWKREMKEQSKHPWGQITVEPSLESDLSMLRSLKAAARAALNQRKTHQDRDAGLDEDDADLGTFVNLVSFPDVFMTKKKDSLSFRRVPPNEIQVLKGS